METRLHARPKAASTPSFTPVRGGLLQRKCTCDGSPGVAGQCEEYSNKRLNLQRSAVNRAEPSSVPTIVRDVLRSPGQPLGADARAFMEPRFGHDFSQVRIHTDSQAAESAQAVNALAYTVGRDVVFATGQFRPDSNAGQRLLSHELAHVVQQGNREAPSTEPEPQVGRTEGGGYRLAVAPAIQNESDGLERQADAAATSVLDMDGQRSGITTGPALQAAGGTQTAIQRTRIALPSPVPLCGKTLTHIDIEPPRALPLEPCLPPTVMVTRINIVGRDLTVPTTGKGSQVFNLHVGYFTDPATGRFCAIADDSKACIAQRCELLGCFPTLEEAVDAMLEFLKKVFVVIGIILLAIFMALIIELLLSLLLAPAALLAQADGGEETEAEA